MLGRTIPRELRGRINSGGPTLVNSLQGCRINNDLVTDSSSNSLVNAKGEWVGEEVGRWKSGGWSGGEVEMIGGWEGCRVHPASVAAAVLCWQYRDN